MEHYLDNSATTAVCEKAAENALYAMRECWYNPSSLYDKGLEAERLVTRCRERVAKVLSARVGEIYFTSCGTESNNTAVIGAAEYGKKRGNRIVCTAIEHPSVLKVTESLRERGFEVVRIKPDKNGNISERDIYSAVNDKTVLVSIMAVNNEVGSVMPIECVKPIIKEKNAPALFHCDAVQAFLKKEINPKKCGIDLLSASGHKIHAPKGIGILYKSEKCPIKPFMLGGGQEKGFRSGTESVPLIHALSGAIEDAGDINRNFEYITALNAFAKEQLQKIEGVVFNSADGAFPYIINFSLCGIRSETVLHFLESGGVYVSSGSACSKGKSSAVLENMGISREVADSAIRISFCKNNTEEDVLALCDGLQNAAKRLKRR